MKSLKSLIIIFLFFSFKVFSQDVTTIELHPSSSEEDLLFNNTNLEENQTLQDEQEINQEDLKDSSELVAIDETKSEETDEIKSEETDETKSEEIVKNENESNDSEEQFTISTLGYWENSNKDDLDFLFNNIKNSTSNVLSSYLVESLIDFSKAPEQYTQEEFDNLRIKTLIKMGYKKEAISVLNNIDTYEFYQNDYNRLKLDYYLSTKELSEACNFKNTFEDEREEQKIYILKLSIFCAYLENKIETADLLNSLLLDSNNNDEYFQKIYFQLKNEINEPIKIIKGSYDEFSFSLYSAMIRFGNLSFTENFLEYDKTNLILPIILSSATDISIRLKSAHKAYELGLFTSESLSALYQSVDFSSKELNNPQEHLKKYISKPEIGMALLFQNARVQLLPITKLESLKVFWNYAILNDLEEIAYSLSKNLIESTEPSVELSDYSILIARAHIFNKNFEQAEKWIIFVENYISQSSELNLKQLDNVKFLFELQKSENQDAFLKSLENYLIVKIKENDSMNHYSENLKTIFTLILNDNEIMHNIKDEKKIIDERLMLSNYVINKMFDSSKNNKIGELILTAFVSLNGKSWNELHPQQLKILLESFKRAKLENIFKDLIIEIFEQSKII